MQPHEVLGVRPGAGRSELTQAYRRHVLRHHPDRGGDRATFEAGTDAYRRLVARSGRRDDARPAAPARPDVVFHRRRPPVISSLLGLARRRLGTARPRP